MLTLVLALVACKGSPTVPLDVDGDGYTADDCDDNNPAVNPGQQERCNGVDDDCDGAIDADDPDVNDAATVYPDGDGDGFGSGEGAVACTVSTGFVLEPGDCDDADADIRPGVDEICDDRDNNCDGLVDDADPELVGGENWFADLDEDGSAGTPMMGCFPPADASDTGPDCDDADPNIFPEMVELCDEIDNDCDGMIDDLDEDGVSDGILAFQDLDFDGYGDDRAVRVRICVLVPGLVNNGLDCDDTDENVSLDGIEACNGIDDNCNGFIDDEDPIPPVDARVVYADTDLDGFGGVIVGSACDPGVGEVLVHGDCDDADVNTYPGAPERCDGRDNDCVGDGEEVLATWIPDGGGPELDLTSTLAAGTAAAPVSWTPPEAGELAVCGGTWFVNTNISTLTLTVTGHDAGGPPTFDGGEQAPVFLLRGGQLEASSLSIEHGVGAGDRRALGQTFGGGIHCDGGAVALNNVDVVGSGADFGGGIGGVDCEVEISGGSIEGNEATLGAGLALDGGSLTSTGARFVLNVATTFGGGVFLAGRPEGVLAGLTDSTFSDNRALSGGVALAATDAVATDCQGGLFQRNAGLGAAIHLSGAAGFRSTGCDFVDGGTSDNTFDVMLASTTPPNQTFQYGNGATFYCHGIDGCL